MPTIGRCTFVDLDEATWPYAEVLAGIERAGVQGAGVQGAGGAAAPTPLIIADLPAAPLSADSLRGVSRILAGRVDACLLGDNGLARVQFPPSYRARLTAEYGLASWAGLNCRDRNRVALEGEVAACLDAGVAGLHCVTGDHPNRGGRPDAMAVFDLDAVELVSLAADRGVPCSVAHAPAAPPLPIRLPRLLAKLAAGADTVFVDHCGGVTPVADATAALRATGFPGRVIACVPVAVDEASAGVLASFATGSLPPGYLDTIMLAADPVAAGVAAAIDLGRALLDVPGVDGLDLSGGALPGSELSLAGALGDIADALAAHRSLPSTAAGSAAGTSASGRAGAFA